MLKRKFKFRIKLSKRQQFAAVTVFISIGLFFSHFQSRAEFYFPLAIGLSILAGVISFIVLRFEAVGFRKVTSLILLSFYTGAVAFFYFLLPARLLTRVPAVFLFAVGYYAILLTENIFNVASGRSIQLLRAARSVGLLMSLITVFLFFETILSLHLDFTFNGVLILLVCFPIIYHSLWSMKIVDRVEQWLLICSFLLSLVVAEVGIILSFWPTPKIIQALFLTAFFYLVVGMSQQKLIDRLFPNTIREFIAVALIVFVFLVFTTSWVG